MCSGRRTVKAAPFPSPALDALYRRFGIDPETPADPTAAPAQQLLAANLDASLFRAELARLADERVQLEASIAECSARGVAHPVFGMLRLETIEVWKAMRRGTEPLGESDLDALHACVARGVAGGRSDRVDP